MSGVGVVEGAFIGAFLGLLLVTVVNFIDVTLWQCRKFGNCPGWWPRRWQ